MSFACSLHLLVSLDILSDLFPMHWRVQHAQCHARIASAPLRPASPLVLCDRATSGDKYSCFVFRSSTMRRPVLLFLDRPVVLRRTIAETAASIIQKELCCSTHVPRPAPVSQASTTRRLLVSFIGVQQQACSVQTGSFQEHQHHSPGGISSLPGGSQSLPFLVSEHVSSTAPPCCIAKWFRAFIILCCKSASMALTLVVCTIPGNFHK